MRLSAGNWVMLVVLSLLWAASYVFFELLIPRLPLLTIILGRLTIAAVILQVLSFLTGQATRLSLTEWRSFATMGLLNNIFPFGLIIVAQSRISIGTAAILNALSPLMAAGVAHMITQDDRLSVRRSVGLVLGFGGAAWVIMAQVGGGTASGHWLGVACALLSALSTALAGNYGRRFAIHRPLTAAASQLTAAAALIALPTLVIDQPWGLAAPDMTAWLALAGVGILSTAIAYVLYFQILSSAGATNVLLVVFLVPISAIALSNVVFGEPVPTAAILGVVLLGIGLVCLGGPATRGIRMEERAMNGRRPGLRGSERL